MRGGIWKRFARVYQAAGTASNSLCAQFSARRSLLKVRPPWLSRQFRKTVLRGEGPHSSFPAPEALADAKLGNIGLTGARVETIRALARAVCGGKINLEGVVDSEVLLKRLCEIPGIGKWTAPIRGDASARGTRCFSLQSSRASARPGARNVSLTGATC